MAYIMLPQPERTKSGLEAFTEGLSPGLERAMQIMLMSKMQEAQSQRAWEEGKKIAPEAFTQEYTYKGKPFTPGEGYAGKPVSAFPKEMRKYLKTAPRFTPEKAPAGFQMKMVDGIPQFGYEKPDTLKLEKETRQQKAQQLARANLLRKEFIDRPEIKEFMAIKNKVSSMDALLKNVEEKNSRLALDQGLITLFNKITDPNSVVRESEYERTPHNLSLANRFSGAIEKLKQGGGGLTTDDRKALVWGAKIIANEQGKMFNERLNQYSDIASAYELDPSLITAGVDKFSPYSINDNQIAQSILQPQEQEDLDPLGLR